MKFILGKKLEMSQIFTEAGQAVPVTKLSAGPCTLVQVKTANKDGYSAVQFGYGIKKEKNINKPQIGHFNKTIKQKNNETEKYPRYIREMRLENAGKISNINPGDIVGVSNFKEGDKIQVTATSKGKGFQGVVKRHGFHGSPASHGHKDQLKMPGSIGATGPAHVFKGAKMGGHMGDERVTVKNLEVVKVDAEKNEIYIKGAVPGARNGLVMIIGEGEMQAASNNEQVKNNKKTTDDERAETKETIASEEQNLEIDGAGK